MKKTMIIVLLVLPLLAAMPVISFAQYFNKTYDFDSTIDFGWTLFLQPDSSCLVFGAAENGVTRRDGLVRMIVNKDGSTVLNKRVILSCDTISYYEGEVPGAVKRLPDSSYIFPLTAQVYYTGGARRSSLGLLKLNSALDTVFTRLYTDTSTFFDLGWDLTIMPDGGYLVAGERQDNSGTLPLGLLMRTDSVGHLLWTRTYFYNAGKGCAFNSVESINGRILIGAMSTTTFWAGGNQYDDNQPWFLVLDSVGNIIKDTLYGSRYGGGGYVYKDVNGGYYHWGALDSFLSPDYLSYDNFPGYVAHLDDSFRIQWFKMLGGIGDLNIVWEVKQTHDSNYLVVINKWDSIHNGNIISTLLKLDKLGNTIWQHDYLYTALADNYSRDAVERADGSIVFTGASFNLAEPGSFAQDMWLVSVDVYGNEVTRVASPLPIAIGTLQGRGEIAVWPNPTSGEFTVKVSPLAGSGQGGELTIYNMQGQVVATYQVREGNNELRLPRGLGAGVYVCRYVGDGGVAEVVRLVYEQ